MQNFGFTHYLIRNAAIGGGGESDRRGGRNYGGRDGGDGDGRLLHLVIAGRAGSP